MNTLNMELYGEKIVKQVNTVNKNFPLFAGELVSYLNNEKNILLSQFNNSYTQKLRSSILLISVFACQPEIGYLQLLKNLQNHLTNEEKMGKVYTEFKDGYIYEHQYSIEDFCMSMSNFSQVFLLSLEDILRDHNEINNDDFYNYLEEVSKAIIEKYDNPDLVVSSTEYANLCLAKCLYHFLELDKSNETTTELN